MEGEVAEEDDGRWKMETGRKQGRGRSGHRRAQRRDPYTARVIWFSRFHYHKIRSPPVSLYINIPTHLTIQPWQIFCEHLLWLLECRIHKSEPCLTTFGFTLSCIQLAGDSKGTPGGLIAPDSHFFEMPTDCTGWHTIILLSNLFQRSSSALCLLLCVSDHVSDSLWAVLWVFSSRICTLLAASGVIALAELVYSVIVEAQVSCNFWKLPSCWSEWYTCSFLFSSE